MFVCVTAVGVRNSDIEESRERESVSVVYAWYSSETELKPRFNLTPEIT